MGVSYPVRVRCTQTKGRRMNAGLISLPIAHHLTDIRWSQLAASITVQAIDYQANGGPTDEKQFGKHAQVDEEQQTASHGKRTNHPGYRGAEWAWTIGLALAQDQYTDRHHRECQQGAGVGCVGELADREQCRTRGNDDTGDDCDHMWCVEARMTPGPH